MLAVRHTFKFGGDLITLEGHPSVRQDTLQKKFHRSKESGAATNFAAARFFLILALGSPMFFYPLRPPLPHNAFDYHLDIRARDGLVSSEPALVRRFPKASAAIHVKDFLLKQFS